MFDLNTFNEKYSCQKLLPEVFGVFLRFIHQGLEVSGQVGRIFIVFVSVDVRVLGSTGGVVIVGATDDNGDDLSVHGVEELLRDVVETDGVLEGEVEVVLAVNQIPAGRLVGALAFQVATGPEDINLIIQMYNFITKIVHK
jgi:hypothetical protein